MDEALASHVQQLEKQRQAKAQEDFFGIRHKKARVLALA
jgi:hypothetical protein